MNIQKETTICECRVCSLTRNIMAKAVKLRDSGYDFESKGVEGPAPKYVSKGSFLELHVAMNGKVRSFCYDNLLNLGLYGDRIVICYSCEDKNIDLVGVLSVGRGVK